MKSSRKRLIVGVSILAVAVLATTTAFAIRGMHGPRFLQRIYERVKEKLKLTPAQAQRVDALKDRVLARLKQSHGTRHQWFAQAKKLWLADRIDETQLQELVKRIEQRHLAHRQLAIGAIKELHGILDPAQRRKLVNLIEKFRGRMKKRFGRRLHRAP